MLPIAVRHFINAPGPDGRRDRPASTTRPSSWTSSRRRTRPASGPRPNASCGPTPTAGTPSTRSTPATTRPPRPDRGDPRPGRDSRQRRRLPGLHRPRHPELRDATSQLYYNGVTAGDEREHAQGDRGRAGSRPVAIPGPAFPPRSRPPDPERPGRDHGRQLDGHRASTPSTTASRRATSSWSRVYSGQRHGDPGLHAHAAGDDRAPDDRDGGNAGSFKVSREPVLLRQVTLTTLADLRRRRQPDGPRHADRRGDPDHLHPEPRDARPRLRHDRGPYEHDHQRRRDRDLHPLDPGPGRQPRT